MNRAYLLIGGNIGDRQASLAAAREAIARHCGAVSACSSIYETAAWGEEDQDAFLNQALAVDTGLKAGELMRCILEIEAELGRKREKKYGPRTIDIDILLYNDDVVQQDGLSIPHPRMQDRRFALACLNDIAPAEVHPLLGKTVRQLLEECADRLAVNKIN
jgi:2-amino-4-hydroxy-6-hydroxymethyldihydropteridine diphosphokinase